MVMAMNKSLFLLPLLAIASPALAQSRPVPQLPREWTDPATAQRLTNSMQIVSRALLDLRVGEVQAAIEGRDATPAERNLTVRDMARRNDPYFDQHLQQQVATAAPKLQRSMEAINRALPRMINGLDQAQQAIERAVANMPDPTYPRR